MLWYERARYFNAAKFQHALQSIRFSCAFVYYDHNNGLWNQLDICFKCNLHLVGHFRRSRAHFEWQWELIFICFRKSVCKSVSRMFDCLTDHYTLFPWNKSSKWKIVKMQTPNSISSIVCLRFYLTGSSRIQRQMELLFAQELVNSSWLGIRRAVASSAI